MAEEGPNIKGCLLMLPPDFPPPGLPGGRWRAPLVAIGHLSWANWQYRSGKTIYRREAKDAETAQISSNSRAVRCPLSRWLVSGGISGKSTTRHRNIEEPNPADSDCWWGVIAR